MNASNPIIRYASRSEIPVSFNHLKPLEQIQFLLYQLIYKSYLKFSGSSGSPLLNEFGEYVDRQILRLPTRPNLSGPDFDMYCAIHRVLTNFDPKSISYKHIDDVLSIPLEDNSPLRNCVPHRDFYLPLLSAMGFGYPTDIYGEGKKPSADLYLPGIKVVTPDAPDTQHTFIEFREIHLLDYDFTLVQKIKGYNPYTSLSFFQYLAGFNFSETPLDDIIAIISNFGLEHGIYAESNCILFSAFYDTIMHTNTLKDVKVSSYYPFFEMLTILKDYHRIGNLEDTQVFSILISKFEIRNGENLVNYLNKPAEEVTSNEALAFRKSELNNFLQDKTLELGIYKVAKEDLSDPDPAATSDDGEDLSPPLDPTTDPESDGEPPLPSEDPLNEGNSEPPPRDPTKLLIELARSDETFADFLYRKLVSARIRDLLNNPPNSLPSKEVLLLKKWLTHWINLVSVNTIKDFLSRLSFRLNDVEFNTDSL